MGTNMSARKKKKISKGTVCVGVLAVLQGMGILIYLKRQYGWMTSTMIYMASLAGILLLIGLMGYVSVLQMKRLGEKARVAAVISAVGVAFLLAGEMVASNQALIENVEVTVTDIGKSAQAKSDEVWVSAWLEDGFKKPIASLTVKENIGATYYEDKEKWLLHCKTSDQPDRMTFVFSGSTGQYQLQLSMHAWCGIAEITTSNGDEPVTVDLYVDGGERYLFTVPAGAPMALWKKVLVVGTYALPLIGAVLPFWLALIHLLGALIKSLRNWGAKRSVVISAQAKNSFLMALATIAAPFSYLLFLFTNNSAEIMFTALVELAVIVACGALAMYMVAYTASKHPLTAYLAGVLFAGMLFVAGYLDDVVQKYCSDAETMGITLGILAGIYALLLMICLSFKHEKAKEINMSTVMIGIITAMLLIFNVPKSVGIYREQMNNLGVQYIKKEYNVDSSITDSPNIYWIHCDGMLGLDAVEKYYGDKEETFVENLEARGFMVNRSAKYEGGHFTTACLPSLLSPDFYDSYLYPYAQSGELARLIREKEDPEGIALQSICSTLRANTEVANALRKKGYTIALSSAKWWQFYLADSDEQYDTPDGVVITKTVSAAHTGIRTANANGTESFVNVFIRPLAWVEDVLDINQDETVVVKNLDKARIDKTTGHSTYVQVTEAALSENDGSTMYFIPFNDTHTPFEVNENGVVVHENSTNVMDYMPTYEYASKVILSLTDTIVSHDPNAVIVVQGDHGLHGNTQEDFTAAFGEEAKAEELWNCVISAIRVPEQYQNGEEQFAASNPLNMSRYLVNRFVGKNYEYLPANEPLAQ